MTSAALILAGGGSRRMGRSKQLLPLGERPLLDHVIAAACASSVDQVVVVLGSEATEIRSAVELRRARVVLNPAHAEGMASSLRAGITALEPAVDRVVVMLGDQPAVPAALVDRLLAAHGAGGRAAAAIESGGLLQPPAVVGRELWPALLRLRGDVGLRRVLRERPDQVTAVAVDDATVLADVDTEDEYRQLRERW